MLLQYNNTYGHANKAYCYVMLCYVMLFNHYSAKARVISLNS